MQYSFKIAAQPLKSKSSWKWNRSWTFICHLLFLNCLLQRSVSILSSVSSAFDVFTKLCFYYLICTSEGTEHDKRSFIKPKHVMYFFKKIQQMQLFSDKQYCEPSLRPNILNLKKVKSYIHIVLLTKYNHRHKERQLWLDNLYSENDYQYFRNG